jgi:hypothetical protein
LLVFCFSPMISYWNRPIIILRNKFYLIFYLFSVFEVRTPLFGPFCQNEHLFRGYVRSKIQRNKFSTINKPVSNAKTYTFLIQSDCHIIETRKPKSTFYLDNQQSESETKHNQSVNTPKFDQKHIVFDGNWRAETPF